MKHQQNTTKLLRYKHFDKDECNPGKAQHKSYVKRKYSKYQGMKIRANPFLEAYIPKKSDLANYSNNCISAIINRINNTPMKCLKFLTPREVFEGRYLKINKEQRCT